MRIIGSDRLLARYRRCGLRIGGTYLRSHPGRLLAGRSAFGLRIATAQIDIGSRNIGRQVAVLRRVSSYIYALQDEHSKLASAVSNEKPVSRKP